jgi:hypothetical protein
MKSLSDPIVSAAAVAGIVAGVGDLAIPMALARRWPGYDSARDVLSRLGCADSPVRLWINAWWCLFGALIIAFAWGYYRVFVHGAPLSAAGLAALLLVVFGLGAGPGAGLFPMDVPGQPPTPTGALHHRISGVGFVALFFVPLVGLAVFGGRSPVLFWGSLAAALGGIAALGMIVVSSRPKAAGILALGGMWQRVFLLNYYLYFFAIAFEMLRRGARA